MNKTTRVVAYYRVSTQKQKASGLGLEGQQAAVATYAEWTGVKVLAEYTESESGKRSDAREANQGNPRGGQVGPPGPERRVHVGPYGERRGVHSLRHARG